MVKFIGTKANQVPTNGHLGSMAFENADQYVTNTSSKLNAFRNFLINGDFMVAQRSTSTASITSSGYHTVDRWYTALFSLGTWTQSRETDVPSGVGTDVQFKYSLKMLNTGTDDSPASNNYCLLQQHTEGQNLQSIGKGTNNARPIVLSFWVKSNVVGRYNVSLRDQDNTRFCTRPYIIKASDTWQQVVLKFPADHTGTLDADNNKSLTVEFWLGSGSNFSSGSSYVEDWTTDGTTRAAGNVNVAAKSGGYFMITGVQLELGEENTIFEHLPYDVNLQRCQRYCEKIDKSTTETVICLGQGIGSNQVFGRIYFATTKRVVPSGTISSASDFQVLNGSASSWSTASSASIEAGDERTLRINLSGLSGMTTAGCHEIRINGGSGYIIYDAEL